MIIYSKDRLEWEQDKYRLALLSVWKSEGMTDADVAKEMGITRSTLNAWRKASPQIAEALATGKAQLVKKLIGKTAQLAMGYEYEETKTIILGDAKAGSNAMTNQRSVRVEKTKKHLPPQLGALVFMLTNLAPEEWRNTQKVDITATDGKMETLIAGLKQNDTAKEE